MALASSSALRHMGTTERCPCLGGCVLRDTTQQHNTHITDVREIWYSWHPWHGRAVRVHASLVKRGQAVAHCSLEDVQACRVLEVPLWMLDVAACCKTRASKPGFASAQSLRDLKEVLQAARPQVPAPIAPKAGRWDSGDHLGPGQESGAPGRAWRVGKLGRS